MNDRLVERKLAGVIAQLRHAYQQLMLGEVKNQHAFARGLIGPQIKKLEQVSDALVLAITDSAPSARIISARLNDGFVGFAEGAPQEPPPQFVKHRSGCAAWVAGRSQHWIEGDEARCNCGATPAQEPK